MENEMAYKRATTFFYVTWWNGDSGETSSGVGKPWWPGGAEDGLASTPRAGSAPSLALSFPCYLSQAVEGQQREQQQGIGVKRALVRRWSICGRCGAAPKLSLSC